MVARGDLGIEIPAEEVPLVQKQIVWTCRRRSAPVIVATQMLESMITSPRATRAEISDVANAIFDGADAVMLSGETAYGEYAIEAVDTMARVAVQVEANLPPGSPAFQHEMDDLQGYMCVAAADAVAKLDVAAVVIPTGPGQTARRLASLRLRTPIYAPCYMHDAVRRLALSYGVDPFPISARREDPRNILLESLDYLVEHQLLTPDDLVVILQSTLSAPQFQTNQLRINWIKATTDTLRQLPQVV